MSRDNFWKNIEAPIKVLAPMAGYTDSAFRLLCREFGADVVITELISADAIAYGKLRITNHAMPAGRQESRIMVESNKSHSTAELLSYNINERPLVVQLFGKNPENFAKAAEWITKNLKPDGIDINMGCPARKVVGSDHGAALLKNSTLAVEIVRAVKDNTDLPVSVKTRLGWENDDEILEFGPKLVNAGISAIIVHGRTYKDGFKGTARWENIYRFKEMVGDKVVVIGNGDIGINHNPYLISHNCSKHSVPGLSEDNIPAIDSLLLAPNSQLKLDGYAIGRAAVGRPWIFAKGEKSRQSSVISHQFLKKTILRHAELAYETKGEHGIIEFRKHLLLYLKGFPEAKKMRLRAVKIDSIDDIKAIISDL